MKFNCSSLNNIYRWCQKNGLYLKFKICLMITFSLKTKPTQFDYSLENINLLRVTRVHDLGVRFNMKLSFNDHIYFIMIYE